MKYIDTLKIFNKSFVKKKDALNVSKVTVNKFTLL